MWDRVGTMSREGRRGVRRERRRERRQRRAPEVARTLLLDAAERVFAKHQPDEVGLKDIAREAGTSHALITHYFGTYAGLIEATLERRIRQLRETMQARLRTAGALQSPGEMLGLLFRTLEDPVHLRLMKWMTARETPSTVHSFALQERGIQQVARQVAEALTPERPPPKAILEPLELAMTTAVAAAFGWSASKEALSGAIGRSPSRDLDLAIQQTLGGMLEAYLRERLAPIVLAADFGEGSPTRGH